jgi:uncharacterized protein YjiS (DUF1127 family)
MSGLTNAPRNFVRSDTVIVTEGDKIKPVDTSTSVECSTADHKKESILLPDDHLVLLAVDGMLALYRLFVKWLRRWRTLGALAELDQRQLRDIGLTREDTPSRSPFDILDLHKSYRALAELDDTQLCQLSERGLQIRRETRRKGR